MSNFSLDDLINKGMKELNKGVKEVQDLFENVTTANPKGEVKKNVENTAFAAINIVETRDSYKVAVAAPGFGKEHIKLTVVEGKFVIRGKKEAAELPTGTKYVLREFGMGDFERTFEIPETVDISQIKATYKDGVLYITLGKKASAIQDIGIDVDIM